MSRPPLGRHVEGRPEGRRYVVMYSQRVLDHFHHPRNVGEIENATALVEVVNPVCGDVMKLWVVARDAVVVEVKFKTAGCVPSVACGSWLTEAMRGQPLAQLSGITPEQIESGVGGLPAASHHAAVLATDALKQLLSKLPKLASSRTSSLCSTEN
jgi:nitrogen fixation NifU-like protein